MVVVRRPKYAPRAAGISIMPSLFRFLVCLGIIGGLAYGAVFSLANFVKIPAARDRGHGPADKFVKQPRRRMIPKSMSSDSIRGSARFSRTDHAQAEQSQAASDDALIELFLDMHGGRARRRREYACRLSQRSRRSLPRICTPPARQSRKPTPTTCAAFSQVSTSAALPPPRWRGGCRRLRQLYRFLYAEGKRGDDPAAVLEGPKRGAALPKMLVDRRSRSRC